MTSFKNLTTLMASAAVLLLAVVGPANADQRHEQVRANFMKADVNQDQQLDFGEFRTFINLNADHGLGRAGMIRRFGMHSRAFGRIDANQDGVVTTDEIRAQAQP